LSRAGGLQPSIWVVGSTMVDMITYADRLPVRGETLVGRSFSLGFGGKGANQAVMARRLGAEVAMVNCLGADVFGDMTLDNFRREGIDVTHIARTQDAASGVAPIWVEPGGANRIIVVPGANEHLRADDAAQAIREASAVDVVIGQLEIGQDVTAAAFAAARARGAVTVLNPAPAALLSTDLARETDWLVPNEGELIHLSTSIGLDSKHSGVVDATTLRAVGDAFGTRMLVTLGERGAALLTTQGELVEIAAAPVEAIDTTGAGDAFVGAFAYGLATGMTEEAAVQLGCACATSSVLRAGTQASFLTSDEANRLRESV
jgi:ribokinase